MTLTQKIEKLNAILELLYDIDDDSDLVQAAIYKLSEYVNILEEQQERDMEGYDPSVL